MNLFNIDVGKIVEEKKNNEYEWFIQIPHWMRVFFKNEHKPMFST